jgi:hypothetical protein
MLNCKQVTQLLSESFERKLPFGLKCRIWIHYILCRKCIQYRRQLVLIQKLSNKYLAEIDPEPLALQISLSVDARNRMKTVIRTSLA